VIISVFIGGDGEKVDSIKYSNFRHVVIIEGRIYTRTDLWHALLARTIFSTAALAVVST
jgi:hypothetical protein